MKSISYAYASSDNAKQCGFYTTGCYCVSFTSPNKRKRKEEVKGFASYAEAFRFAETLPGEYAFYSTNLYHGKNGFVHASEEVRKFHLGETL